MAETREVWAKRVERWSESGLTGAEYAAEIGVKEATLRHWKWALARHAREPGWEAKAARRRRAQHRAAAFIELVTPADEKEAEPFELVLGDGLRIRVPPRFDATSLRRLLEAVRSC